MRSGRAALEHRAGNLMPTVAMTMVTTMVASTNLCRRGRRHGRGSSRSSAACIRRRATSSLDSRWPRAVRWGRTRCNLRMASSVVRPRRLESRAGPGVPFRTVPPNSASAVTRGARCAPTIRCDVRTNPCDSCGNWTVRRTSLRAAQHGPRRSCWQRSSAAMERAGYKKRSQHHERHAEVDDESGDVDERCAQTWATMAGSVRGGRKRTAAPNHQRAPEHDATSASPAVVATISNSPQNRRRRTRS